MADGGVQVLGLCRFSYPAALEGFQTRHETMEARRQVEGRRIDSILETECRMAVFKRLHTGEADTEEDRQQQTLEEMLPIAFTQGMMRPGHRDA